MVRNCGEKAKPDAVRGAEYPAHGIRFCVAAASIKTRKRLHPKQDVAFNMAERKGFEPLRALGALHDFQSCALDQLSHLSIFFLRSA